MSCQMGILWTFCWQRSREFSLGLTSQSLSHGRPTGRFGTLHCCLSSCWPAGSITLSLVRPCESLCQFSNICGMACSGKIMRRPSFVLTDLPRFMAGLGATFPEAEHRIQQGWQGEPWDAALKAQPHVEKHGPSRILCLWVRKKFNCIEVYGLKFSSRKSLLLVYGSLMIFADPEIAKHTLFILPCLPQASTTTTCEAGWKGLNGRTCAESVK